MTSGTTPQLPKWGHCYGEHWRKAIIAGSARAGARSRDRATQGPWQGLWGALQRVSSLAAVLTWPAEHLQEFQPTLTALTPRLVCDGF